MEQKVESKQKESTDTIKLLKKLERKYKVIIIIQGAPITNGFWLSFFF